MSLREVGIKLLNEHNGVKGALDPFVVAVKGDKLLLQSLAQDYLGRLAQTLIKKPEQNGARGKKGPQRKHRQLPTSAEKSAALRGASATAISFLDQRKLRDGRLIGDIPLWELSRLARTAAHKGADFLRRGLEDWTDAIACEILARYAQPSNQDTRVRDTMKGKQVEEIYARARKLAAEKIAEESERCAQGVMTVSSEPAQIAS